jgi:hypothetical protein
MLLSLFNFNFILKTMQDIFRDHVACTFNLIQNTFSKSYFCTV